MANLTISSAASLTGATTASGDLFPCLDVSAASGSQGSKITRDELGDAMTRTAAIIAALAAKLDRAGGTMTGPLIINAGVAIASANPLSISQTWNNAAVAFQGPKITIIDQASSVTEQYFGIYGGVAGATKLLGLEKIGGANVLEATSMRSTTNAWSLDFSEVGLAFGSNKRLSWSSTTNYYDSKDLVLSRSGAAKLQLGLDHATTATNQTIKAHNVTTGTGAALALCGGTGSVSKGAVIISDAVDMPAGFHGAFSAQATTAGSAVSHTPGMGTTVTEDSTFGGYLIGQLVYALQQKGILA